ncbi:hypothetical protein [Halorubrum sp. Atlit-26R]|uniref:hypothetical protein n=1 Tax=Halorubrum sp. Atlit-26R TaxID=2282128 RepID=UPI000F2CF29B|nr:hypothetical protein [Halorubrum sp. Atlit-26R]RLM68528.1 hypothetical protein DVK07_10425 [Halorubrum sp. Atlit-26R]
MAQVTLTPDQLSAVETRGAYTTTDEQGNRVTIVLDDEPAEQDAGEPAGMVAEVAAVEHGDRVRVTLESGESFEGTATEPASTEPTDHHHAEASFVFDGVDMDHGSSVADYAAVRQIEKWGKAELDDPELVYAAGVERHIPSTDDERVGVVESIRVLSS